MADFNYEEIKEKIKYGEQTRKEEEKLSKIVEADENTKTAKKNKNNDNSEIETNE